MIEERHPARHRQPLESTAMELATKRVQKGDVHGRWFLACKFCAGPSADDRCPILLIVKPGVTVADIGTARGAVRSYWPWQRKPMNGTDAT